MTEGRRAGRRAAETGGADEAQFAFLKALSAGYGDAWALRLDDGTLFMVSTTAAYAVRAVRGGV